MSVRVNINTDMGVMTITVTEEAYKMLAKEKKEDESFSEVIKRLTKELESSAILSEPGR